MARTRRGKLIGRAATAELRDQRNQLYEQLDKEKLERDVEEIHAENDAIRRCIALEGEQSFYKWWDDDEQVPPYGARKERIEMIEKRIKFLSSPMLFDHEGSVPNEKADGEKSQ